MQRLTAKVRDEREYSAKQEKTNGLCDTESSEYTHIETLLLLKFHLLPPDEPVPGHHICSLHENTREQQ
jgi:hypothetical protein